MSVQIFLLGKILGIHDYLHCPPGDSDLGASDDLLLKGRCRWVALLSEILPRALLAELGLARVLLGSSGGGQFLVVLPLEARTDADRFLAHASQEIESLSGGALRLVTAVTENLGDWNIVRKRLNDEMQRKRGAPAAERTPGWFQPFPPGGTTASDGYVTTELAGELQAAGVVGWSPEMPARVLVGQGRHTWQLSSSPAPDAIPLARHTALEEDAAGSPAGVRTLAARSRGRRGWGVLRGDVDNFGVRLRRVQTIEEHLQLSVMYKQFFAGELELLCSMPEYWKKTSILYSGGDDFAIYGSWDSLIPLAREIHRLFHRFTEENLKDFPGPEGKTITMALAFAGAGEQSLVAVYETAGARLDLAKSVAKDCVYVLGRTLEWRQLSAASDLRETIERLAGELDSPKHFLSELAGVYRKAAVAPASRGSEGNFDRPWRIQRRLGRALGEASDREHQKLRAQLTNEMLVKSVAHVRLRPGGRVALEWARLLIEV